MSLANLMELSENKGRKKMGMSEERVMAQKAEIAKAFSRWREYPDEFVEFLVGDNPENFHLFFYQRLFLRAVMRHRYAYATFPRAYLLAPSGLRKLFPRTNFFNCGNSFFIFQFEGNPQASLFI